jgi:hypothetical protein
MKLAIGDGLSRETTGKQNHGDSDPHSVLQTSVSHHKNRGAIMAVPAFHAEYR